MADREKVIKGLECCLDCYVAQCEKCPYQATEEEKEYVDWDCHHDDLQRDALELLKEQDKRYKEMVVEWLREIAHNNYQECRKMDFLDAILEIRERAMIGLENYFKDYKKG